MSYEIGSYVQITNHSEPDCNGQYGTIESIQIAYDGYTYYYNVKLEETDDICLCIDDELMEG